MIRFLTLTALLLTSPAFAADNGGFGNKFTGKAPTALMESPDSQFAQSVIAPSPGDLDAIMPASGDEDVSVETMPSDQTKDILSAEPTTTHENNEAAPASSAEE